MVVSTPRPRTGPNTQGGATPVQPHSVEVKVSALTPDVERALADVEASVHNRFADAATKELSTTEAAALKLALAKLESSFDMVSGVSKAYHDSAMAIIRNLA